ncbi:hypothetical protein C8J57DRAFT_1306519 [Mycena rebaudengoi]|nr:hypothetical protein C8J57DRAFT_1306519 [Mycena rebaudengoi]
MQFIIASFAAISVALNSVGVGARNRITAKVPILEVPQAGRTAGYEVHAVGTCSAAIGIEDNREEGRGGKKRSRCS